MTQALYTSMTGLNAGTQQLTVVSDNVANMNTTAYKTSRVDFQDIWYNTKTEGTSSTRNSGGTNPYQIGVGVQCASITKNFAASSINSTGRSEDLALTGDGWFTIINSDDEVLLTRDGTFTLDENGYMCTASGCKVLGMDSDIGFTRSTTPIRIPTQVKVVENGTKSDKLNGMFLNDLNALDASHNGISDGKFLIKAVTDEGTTEITVELEDTDDMTVASLVTKINSVANGKYTCTCKDGYLEFKPGDGVTALKFESVTTPGEATSNFVTATNIASMPKVDGVYKTKILNMSATISEVEDISSDTTKIYKSYTIGKDGMVTARYSDGSYLTVQKDDYGKAFFSYTDSNGIIINDDTDNSGEASLYVDENLLKAANMQMQLAKVTNNSGLVAVGSNQYQIGVDSGEVIYTAAGVNGVSGVTSGALETSNVDLAQQFANMILAQRLVQANSQVFNGANTLLETLVYLGR